MLSINIILLFVNINGLAFGAALSVAHWIDTQDSQLVAHQKELDATGVTIGKMQGNIENLEKKISELEIRVTALHTESDKADAELQSQMKLLQALSGFAAEHATAPPLPQAPRK